MNNVIITNFYKIFFITLIVLIAKTIVFAELTTSQIAKKFSTSVITIVAVDENDQPLSIGSGFIINEKCDIATNYHVLERCKKAILKTTNGIKGSIINVISYNIELDLLIAETSLKYIKPLSYGDSDTITVGEDIVAIGNPAGLEGSISKGIISGIRKLNDFKIIQITAPISPGSSGGPVINLNGKVIGIATAYLDYGQSLNFAMPINYLISLKKNKKNISLSSLPNNSKSKHLNRDNSLVQVFDIHYNYADYYTKQHINAIDFAVKNVSNYPISDIIIFFVYYNSNGEVVSYSSEKLNKPILPKLALQFEHIHYVKYFNAKNKKGVVELRILDYKIDKTSELSPSDLLFK